MLLSQPCGTGFVPQDQQCHAAAGSTTSCSYSHPFAVRLSSPAPPHALAAGIHRRGAAARIGALPAAPRLLHSVRSVSFEAIQHRAACSSMLRGGSQQPWLHGSSSGTGSGRWLPAVPWQPQQSPWHTCDPPRGRCLTPAGASAPSAAEAAAADCSGDGASSARAAAEPLEPDAAAAAGAAADADVDVLQILSDPDIEGDPLHFLQVTEAYWKALRASKHNPGKRGPAVVSKRYRSIGPTNYDVCVAGGTLGVFLALALQLRGHSVCIVERRAVEGRTQEWNISRGELGVLTRLGLLSAAEAEAAVVASWNPMRVGFKGGRDLWVDDVLNLGVDPRYLIAKLRARFLEAGGAIFERTTFTAAEAGPDGILIKVAGRGAAAPAEVGDANRPTACRPEDLSSSPSAHSGAAAASSAAEASAGGRCGNGSGRAGASSRPGGNGNGSNGSSRSASGGSKSDGKSGGEKGGGQRREIRARLLVDCCGHYSPVVKQMRGGAKPQAMVLVVGSCADGIPAERNRSGDLLYTFTDAEDDLQLFWEAFPAAGGGRTTYMFAYADADARRPSFEALLKKYFQLLPEYQGVPLAQLKLRRVLFGGFPCYQDAPLQTHFDRVLQIGDAAAAQSPLSFGGFGAMLRHLPRLAAGVDDALRGDRLEKADLALLQPYQPSLSAAWLFQRSMSLRPGEQKRETGGPRSRVKGRVPADHVNRLMRCNFSVMRRLGDRVLRPFLQDTIRFWPLAVTMLGMSFRDPVVIFRVVCLVGLRTLLGWCRHYFALAAYSLLHAVAGRWAAKSRWFRVRRWAEAWAWGSGQDNGSGTPQSEQQPPAADWGNGSGGGMTNGAAAAATPA